MTLSCSVGSSTSTRIDPLLVVDSIIHADAKMYVVKQARKLESDLSIQAVALIKSSIKNNLIDVWYQPIVSASKDEGYHIIGAEALLRIRDKSGKHLSPDKFLPQVHEHEIAIALDDKVASRAFEDLGKWRKEGLVGPDFYVAVNLCGATAGMDTMPALLSEKISKFKIPAKNIVVELSEQTQIIKPEMLSALKNLGVKIAIDDIGLLNSNLERLASSEADIAKFDRFWLSKSQKDAQQSADNNIDLRKTIVLKNLIAICKRLGMECVIEGVEDRRQLSASREIGINRFQGYLFDRSLSPEQFTRKLENAVPSLWTNAHSQYEVG